MDNEKISRCKVCDAHLWDDEDRFEHAHFEFLVGKIISKINLRVGQEGSDLIEFHCHSGEVYKMCHYQDCCESVYVDDICGDIKDLIGQEILVAEKRTSCDYPKKEDLCDGDFDEDESCTWTFYTIRTNQATIDIRWYGQSNGYYSEEVDFERVK